MRKAHLGFNASREPTLVDITNDSVKDILVGTEDGYVVAIDGRTLEELWRLDMGSRVITPVVVGDLDGDGMAELVVSDAEGDLVAIDGYPRPKAWLESPTPNENTTLYAEHTTYDFTVRAWSGWDAGYLRDMTMELDPDGVGAVLSWDRVTGSAELLYGDEHVILDSYMASTDGTNWTVTFGVRFKWSYPHEEPCRVVVGLRNMALRSGGGTFRDVFRIETDVELSGPLTAIGEWQGPLSEGDWIRSGETVNLSGPVVVYEGSLNMMAPLDVTVYAEDDTGGVSTSPLEAGTALEMEVRPESVGDAVFTWRFSLGDLPGGCEDRTNLSFTLQVDGTPPEVLTWTPSGRSWLFNTTVECTLEVRDPGSGMGPGCVQLRLGDGDWIDVTLAHAAGDQWSFSITLELAEGWDNLIEWRCYDRVGNGPSGTGVIELWVDTLPLVFGSASPTSWVNDTGVLVSIEIVDATSGVDPASLEYRTEGGDWASDDISWDGINASVRLALPEGRTLIMWRARDVAGNGPISSAWHEVLVDRTPPVLVEVEPSDGHIFHEVNVSFTIVLVDVLSGVSPDECLAVLRPVGEDETTGVDVSVSVIDDRATVLFEGVLAEDWYELSLQAGDMAGNAATYLIGPFGVDLSPPTFSDPWPGPDDIQPTGEILCTVRVVDLVSGISGVEWTAWWPGTEGEEWSEATVEASGNGTSVMATTGSIHFPAGREGRIEWRAVDGVGLTSTSGALEVWINRPPRATIDAPRDGGEIRPGVDLRLRSESTDPDGHTLNETWSSDIDGDLGVGSEVLVRLSEGEHVLTLRVEDPLGGV
ncbi:MAG: hypothetical protein GQ558_08735, partial [Thermoplasmata archaeon]|nr:hypothetical protein [Thermoplasmata archaeon]